MSEAVYLRFDEQLRRDGGTQVRASIDPQLVAEYAAILEDQEELDPGLAFYDGSVYWLVDGFHRAAAYERIGMAGMPCVVRPGTQAEAQWASYAQNAKHGKKRSPSDTRRAIRAAFFHPMSKGLTDRGIATHINCDHKTVGSVRAEMVAAGEIPQSDIRMGRDGREINVSGINAGRSTKAEQQSTVNDVRAQQPDMRPMATDATKFRGSDPLPFKPKAAPPGGWPVAGEDGNFDDSAAECLVDAVAQRWCDIKILELEPSGLFHREEWIAAFSIGCKPCVYSEPLTDKSEEHDSYPTREEALREAALRLAMCCWRNHEDASVPKTAKEVLLRFQQWALDQGSISGFEFQDEVETYLARQRRRISDRVTQYKDAIDLVSGPNLGEDTRAADEYGALAKALVEEATGDADDSATECINLIDDAAKRIAALASALRDMGAIHG